MLEDPVRFYCNDYKLEEDCKGHHICGSPKTSQNRRELYAHLLHVKQAAFGHSRQQRLQHKASELLGSLHVIGNAANMLQDTQPEHLSKCAGSNAAATH